ncbi:hypothetical protein KV557_19315 [Kitasatospora aureofaciens]|nr:hypothetical protein [Kitasatospora aureofaciens]MBV6699246.1 hypothetical protein [Kitasatospora aureofaciens]
MSPSRRLGKWSYRPYIRAELTEFITYDHELAKAAEELGFPVAAPL